LQKDAGKFSFAKSYDIFLSHSYLDAEIIAGLCILLESFNLTVYVDWREDKQLDRQNVTRETADLLRTRMKACRSMLYALSLNARESKWMPWELGYFDGGGNPAIAIVPIEDRQISASSFSRQGYLLLYPYLELNNLLTGQKELRIRPNQQQYIELKSWVGGSKAFKTS
jgi:hypothetical protein